MVATSRIAGLNVGVSAIDRMRVEDDVHLPSDSPTARALFLPQVQALDAILSRPTLEERLAFDVVPDRIVAELMAPEVLGGTRLGLASRLSASDHPEIRAAGQLLEHEVTLDEEIQEALAELLRG